MPPQQRIGISKSQKRALRRYHRANPRIKQKQLSQWFFQEFQRVITQSSISDILSKNYSYLDEEEVAHENKNSLRRSHVRYPELEEALIQWHLRYEAAGAVTGDLIKAQARRFWHELPQYQGMELPIFSNGWLDKFKSRHNIKLRARSGESGSVDTAAAAEQIEALKNIMSQYSLKDIYNCDETGLFYKLRPDKSLSTQSFRGQKQDKRRITIHFCCNGDGSHKLPLWVIGKAAQPRCFGPNGRYMASLDCIWKSNNKAWMNNQIFYDWMLWFDKEIRHRKVLLIMDNFSAHGLAVKQLSQKGLLRNITVAYLPPNTTSVHQPLDQGIIYSFKACWKRRWIEFMLEQFDIGKDPSLSMTVLKAVIWCIHSWKKMKTEVISNCWQKSGLIDHASDNARPLNEADSAAEELAERLQLLEQRSNIRAIMSIDQIINPPEEEVIDNDQDITTQIVEELCPEDPEEAEEIDEEAVIPISRLQFQRALELCRNFQLQQVKQNHSFLEAIDSREDELRTESFKNKQQTSLYHFFEPQMEPSL